jgi:D-glycero-alpha-D-manno-heptose-7-phosphate kinase
MIISRTPFRISFVGGGSDLPDYYRQFGGAVISSSINKYMFITVNKKFDNRIRVSYSQTENVEHADQVEHKLVRACLQKLSIQNGIEITSISDIPASGSGLGSSSAYAVGLLHVLHAYQGRYVSKEDLAEQACHIEINVCGEPIGKQDQYASAIGGLNYIRFNPDETVDVEPIICEGRLVRKLQDSLIMFYTGISRSASKILLKQKEVTAASTEKQQTMQKIVELAAILRSEMQRGNIDAFGEILHDSWMLKRGITDDISTEAIDDWYRRGRQAGAIGGKILGAGGGGFLLFFAPLDRHEKIARALPELRQVEIRFERSGSRIIFFDK